MNAPQGAGIAGDAVIGVMTCELAGECRVLLWDRSVSSMTTPLPDPMYGTRQASFRRLAFDDPAPLSKSTLLFEVELLSFAKPD